MNPTPTLPPRTRFGFRLRTLAALLVLALIGALALGADLRAEGRLYHALWELTGETEPLEQLLGFGQYLVRWTRTQPVTEPYAAIPLANVSPFGINTFLEQEVEPEKRARQLDLIAAAGFTWIRQQFPWEDIEIHAKGDFADRRNDLDGDGQITAADAISAWAKYDQIVALAEARDLQILARLSAPPAWSQPPGTTNRYAPPADFQDFVDYAVAVAQRYRGRIHHYQIWNEPNLYPEWGDQTVNAEAYTDLLCRTYAALKAVDPQIVVHTGALGPTIDLSGRNAYDLLYLQRMYQAGAGACFDVLSVQGYGLWSGPTDRRLRQITVNFQRHMWIRDMMVANGDAHKPIWISEAGWNPVPDDPAIADLERYGRVTPQQAAAWAPLAYARAIAEWPWIGGVFWWYFKRADDSERGQSWYYFRLAEPDFTLTPTYATLKAYLADGQPKLLGAGRHGILRGALTITPEADGSARYTLRVRGTGVALCAGSGATLLSAGIDDRPMVAGLSPGESGCVRLAHDLAPGEHTVRFTAAGAADALAIAVFDFTWRQRLPWLLSGSVAAIGVALVIGAAVRGRGLRGRTRL